MPKFKKIPLTAGFLLCNFRDFHFGERLAMANVPFVPGFVFEFYDADFFIPALL